jgi:hypothetical protein
MKRCITALLLVLSTFAHAREPNRPAVRDARESSPPIVRDSDFQSAFVSGFTKSCVKGQLGKPGNKLLSEKLITDICDCSARGTADLLNTQDVELMAGGKMPKTVEQKLDQALDVRVKRMFSSDKQ